MSTDNAKLLEKWGPILEHESFDPIKDSHRRSVTAAVLENTTKSIAEGRSASMSQLLSEAPTNVAGTGGFTGAAAAPVAGYDPVLISLVRRSLPNLIAHDIAGVQPMSGPAGLIFAMRSKYNAPSGNTSTEAFYGEANSAFSGTGTQSGDTGAAGATFGTAMPTATGEDLGAGTAFGEMGISLEKVTVEAKTRALKAEYSTELAQDLRAVHGLDAETELANMLSTEILAEINREVVRTVVGTAVQGAASTATAGTFDLDVDANGRWSVEKFKGLMFQIEQEANAVGKATRRGKGNIIICSSDVASALTMAGHLDFTPALDSNNLNVDDNGNTFAGILNKRFRVYVDPYANANYLVVGYKGKSAFDAGLFYCPYVPLEMYRAIGENTFQPKLGFKTRYGMVANPFSAGATASNGVPTANSNVYYRRVLISNLL